MKSSNFKNKVCALFKLVFAPKKSNNLLCNIVSYQNSLILLVALHSNLISNIHFKTNIITHTHTHTHPQVFNGIEITFPFATQTIASNKCFLFF